MPLLGKEGERRREGETEDCARDPPGARATNSLEAAQHVGVERVDRRTADDVANGVEPVLERRHDAEVPAAASERPEQIVVLLLAADQSFAARGDDLGGDEVVAGEATAAGKEAEASTEGEPGDTRRGDDASRRAQPELRAQPD